MTSMTKKYKVIGLDCANCAREVEQAIKKYDKIADASLSFISEILTVQTKNGFDVHTMLEFAYKVEPDIKCIDLDTNEVFMNENEHADDHHHNHDHKCSCGGNCKCGGHDHEHHECHCGHNHEEEFEVMTHASIGGKLYHHEKEEKRKQRRESALFKYYRNIAIALVSLIVSVVFHAIFPVGYIQSIVFWIGYLLSAWSVLTQAAKRVSKKDFFNEYTLMAVATIAAACLGEFVEAIVVMLLYQVGELLQYTATKNSRASIRKLLEAQERTVEVKRNEKWSFIDVEQVVCGDVLRLKAGSRVPVDGILMGDSPVSMDTSQITGESVPKVIHSGDDVVAGYINANTVVEMKATSAYNTSTVAKIVETIETATEKKSPTEKLTSKFAKVYTPIMFAVALAVILWGVSTAQMSSAIYIAAEILIISCPCALVIAIPLIYFMGLGATSRYGVIVKGANVLETVKDIDVIAFDKTGTLTDGKFAILAVQVNSAAFMTTNELLKIVAHVESASNHPLAKIIVRDSECEIDYTLVSDVVEMPGLGVSALYDGKRVLAGNAQLMSDNNIVFTGLGLEATVIHVAIDGVYMGAIVMGDSLKEDASGIVFELTENQKKECVLLSGDSSKVVKEVSRKVKITEGYGDLKPNDKVEKIKELQQNKKVLFVGDGVNDGPALAMANVGVAMGKNGTDVAIETADVVLLADKISSLGTLFSISAYVRNISRSSIAVILVVKVAILLLSILGIGTMWTAIFADVGLLMIALIMASKINKKFPGDK